MKERILEHYFLAVRMGILLLLEIYIVLSGSILTGASYEVLLLLALLVGTVAGAELTIGIKRWIFFAGAVLMWFILFCNAGSAFWLLGIFLCYEGISYFLVCSGTFSRCSCHFMQVMPVSVCRL